MARVEATTTIEAPLHDAYALAKNVEAFPEFMPDLESVRILERRNSDTVTEWVGLVQGRKIRWVEEDHWDDASCTCRFRQREGDFSIYEGTWSFEAVPGGTKTTLAVEFEIQIPLAGALLSNLLRVLMQRNIESMLQALKGELEHPRAPRGVQ